MLGRLLGHEGTEQGFGTAGHRGDAGDKAFYLVNRNTLSQIGAFAASTFPNADRAWVKVDNGHTLLPSVKGSGGDVAVRGSTEAAIGAAMCRSGRTTGWKCGVIEAKNVSVTYPEGTVNGMTRTNICAEGGDSGGSFITGPARVRACFRAAAAVARAARRSSPRPTTSRSIRCCRRTT